MLKRHKGMNATEIKEKKLKDYCEFHHVFAIGLSETGALGYVPPQNRYNWYLNAFSAGYVEHDDEKYFIDRSSFRPMSIEDYQDALEDEELVDKMADEGNYPESYLEFLKQYGEKYWDNRVLTLLVEADDFKK